jgi:hypothetical protein
MIFHSAVVALLLAVSAGPTGNRAAAAGVPQRVDFRQAELFLRFLRAVATGRPASALIDSLLGQPGTQLVIRQQNISRTVTPEQYRMVLVHAADSTPPAFAPAETERGRRGINGLVQDIWPAVHWGIQNVDRLSERLEQFKTVDFQAAAAQRALEFLPPGARIEAKPFVVMGGRAGGAAFDGGELYFDLLIESHRAALRNEPFPPVQDFVGYFAHEMHHLGLAPLISRTRARLALKPPEARAFDLLTFLVMEGSASYLVGPRDIEKMRVSPTFGPFLKDPSALLATCERVLQGTLHEGLEGEALDRAQAPLVGSGWHSAGALMLAAVDRSGGLDAILPLLTDPRRLLLEYNRAGGKPPVAAQLAEEVLHLGEH